MYNYGKMFDINMNFAIIGSGGYIANRHISAISALNGNLLLAFDPNLPASEEKIHPFFPKCKHFSIFESFYYECLQSKIDYLVIASPNFLHAAHINLGLMGKMNVICEKPLVLNAQELAFLQGNITKYNKQVCTLLQLRKQKSLTELKAKIMSESRTDYVVNLKYIAPRDDAYLATWKGKQELSGGIVANIGIHFFDLLIWLFGGVKNSNIQEKSQKTISGQITLENASIEWLLSIDKNNLPNNATGTYRSITINGDEIDFSSVGEDLHTQVYKDILAGKDSFEIKQAVDSLNLMFNILQS